MPTPNPATPPERALIASLRRYAKLRGARLQVLADGWMAVLEKDGVRHPVFGYDLGLNGSAASRIANDKGATYEVLAAAGVPALEHRAFLHPRFLDFVSTGGNWPGLLKAFQAFGSDAVIKDNEGTGGMEVFRVRTQTELEQRTHSLFQIARAVALSPFVAIEDESRFVMLDGTCVLAYAKERPSVTGDGKRALGELIAGSGVPMDTLEAALTHVPAAGEVVPLQWRHNLGLGAQPRRLSPENPHLVEALGLARKAMEALCLRFASIDIVAVGGHLKVMEANAGVMLEVASRPDFGGTSLADGIYHRVLDLALAGHT